MWGRWKSDDSNSISVTNTTGPEAWWKLTFTKIYFIDSIILWNRQDDENRKKKNWNKRINGVSVQLSSAVIGKVTMFLKITNTDK